MFVMSVEGVLELEASFYKFHFIDMKIVVMSLFSVQADLETPLELSFACVDSGRSPADGAVSRSVG